MSTASSPVTPRHATAPQPQPLQHRTATALTESTSRSLTSDRGRRASVQATTSLPHTNTLSASQVLPKRQSLDYYKPVAETQPPWLRADATSLSTPVRPSATTNSSRPPSRQSLTRSGGTVPVSFVTPQKTTHPTVVYTPGGGGNLPWMPPGAQRPQNVYERRF